MIKAAITVACLKHADGQNSPSRLWHNDPVKPGQVFLPRDKNLLIDVSWLPGRVVEFHAMQQSFGTVKKLEITLEA